jgi:hypothetical protein
MPDEPLATDSTIFFEARGWICTNLSLWLESASLPTPPRADPRSVYPIARTIEIPQPRDYRMFRDTVL